MMKKMLALVLALLVCMAAAPAMAEEIELEMAQLTNGLCFPVPADWTDVELSQQDREEGYLAMKVEEATGRCMMVTATETDATITNQELAQAFSGDSDYGSVSLREAGSLEAVLYTFADETLVGYCFVDGEGLMYNFSFLNANGDGIGGDAALLAMAQQCMENTGFEAEEEELSVSLNSMEEAASGIQLEEYITDSLVFALPAGWTEVELSQQDMEDGCLVMLKDKENGYEIMVMVSEIGEGLTNAHVVETLGQDADYALVRLVSNGHGQELVQLLTADLTTGGYALVDHEGWMYLFMFSGQEPITGDALLTQLVSDCMECVYFEE